MKEFCEPLKEHVMKKIDSVKKTITSLTDKGLEFYGTQENCHIHRKRFEDNELMIKNVVELEIIVITEVSAKVLHVAYGILNILYLKNLLLLVTMDQTINIIL